jgi:pilus assembly protein CpaF
MLQAMNTGHEGSMATIHSNNPREAVSRLEQMVAMGGLNIGPEAVRYQIAAAVGLVVQVKRLSDGKRKVTHVTEIVGMEGTSCRCRTSSCSTAPTPSAGRHRLPRRFRATGLRPRCLDGMIAGASP